MMKYCYTDPLEPRPFSVHPYDTDIYICVAFFSY